MSYVLTEHARDALEKRQIAVAWVECVFDAPEATDREWKDNAAAYRDGVL